MEKLRPIATANMNKQQIKKLYPQCAFLDGDGKRCRSRSAIKGRVHLDNEIYSNAWVEVNLCPDHYISYGFSFFPKSRKPTKIKK